MLSLKEFVEARLKELGIGSIKAARLGGLERTFIRDILTGKKLDVTSKHAERLAIALQLTVPEIQNRKIYPKEIRTVPLVGYVAAGAEAVMYADGQLSEDVPAPDGATEDTVAVEIRGDSLGSFFDQWLIFYDDVRSPVTSDLIGELCVIGLPDGRVVVKKIKRSPTKGLFHLFGQFGDPILDTPIEWAARVKSMVPR